MHVGEKVNEREVETVMHPPFFALPALLTRLKYCVTGPVGVRASGEPHRSSSKTTPEESLCPGGGAPGRLETDSSSIDPPLENLRGRIFTLRKITPTLQTRFSFTY